MEEPNKAEEAGKAGEEDAGAAETEKKEEGGEEGAAKEGKEEKPEAKQDEDPPLRKTKLEYILERKEKQLEKAKKGKVEEEDEIAPADEELVTKVFEKKYGKQFAKMDAMGAAEEARANEAEIQSFLGKDPLGKYCKDIEGKIRTWSQHPSRSSVPIKTIALEILGDKLIGVGAEMEREATKKAAETKTAGGSARATGGGKVDYSSMTNEEMEKEIAKAKGGQ